MTPTPKNEHPMPDKIDLATKYKPVGFKAVLAACLLVGKRGAQAMKQEIPVHVGRHD